MGDIINIPVPGGGSYKSIGSEGLGLNVKFVETEKKYAANIVRTDGTLITITLPKDYTTDRIQDVVKKLLDQLETQIKTVPLNLRDKQIDILGATLTYKQAEQPSPLPTKPPTPAKQRAAATASQQPPSSAGKVAVGQEKNPSNVQTQSSKEAVQEQPASPPPPPPPTPPTSSPRSEPVPAKPEAAAPPPPPPPPPPQKYGAKPLPSKQEVAPQEAATPQVKPRSPTADAMFDEIARGVKLRKAPPKSETPLSVENMTEQEVAMKRIRAALEGTDTVGEKENEQRNAATQKLAERIAEEAKEAEKAIKSENLEAAKAKRTPESEARAKAAQERFKAAREGQKANVGNLLADINNVGSSIILKKVKDVVPPRRLPESEPKNVLDILKNVNIPVRRKDVEEKEPEPASDEDELEWM